MQTVRTFRKLRGGGRKGHSTSYETHKYPRAAAGGGGAWVTGRDNQQSQVWVRGAATPGQRDQGGENRRERRPPRVYHQMQVLGKRNCQTFLLPVGPGPRVFPGGWDSTLRHDPSACFGVRACLPLGAHREASQGVLGPGQAGQLGSDQEAPGAWICRLVGPWRLSGYPTSHPGPSAQTLSGPCGQPPPQGGSVNLGFRDKLPRGRTPNLPTSPSGPSMETLSPTLTLQGLRMARGGLPQAWHTAGTQKAQALSLPNTTPVRGLCTPAPRPPQSPEKSAATHP